MQVVVDAADPSALARWWAEALGWRIVLEEPDEVEIRPLDDGDGIPLVFVPVTDPKAGKNRVHLDLASPDMEEHSLLVDRLTEIGARPADIGQGEEVPWVVLVDPEGNELCALEPRERYADTGPVAAIVVDVDDPEAQAAFWSAAAGWPIVSREDGVVGLRSPSGRGPFLEFVAATAPKRVKNRLHLDVAPYPDDDHMAEAERLCALGAARIDIGQRGVRWVVLADPEGQEFCVLTPR